MPRDLTGGSAQAAGSTYPDRQHAYDCHAPCNDPEILSRITRTLSGLTMVVGRDPRLHEFDRLLDGTRRGEHAWYRAIRRLLETAYLAADDPAAQSGKAGGLAAWEVARRPIAAAINRDGTFLDIGCANGLLMESIVAWASEAGCNVEPFGLDLSPALARLARQRLPDWADRIWAGNAMTWQPPHKFDFVRTELVYVPPGREPELVHRLLTDVVAPGGRLLVCSYGSSSGAEPRVQPLEEVLAAWGFPTHGNAEARASNGVIITRVVWIDRSARVARATRSIAR
jgi:SAM-dependent methyltransferase